ncbi:MAG: RNA polymerase sigma factor region1.1 domain-containing protein, partial [Candidatus Moraniibacteriota bacterium]
MAITKKKATKKSTPKKGKTKVSGRKPSLKNKRKTKTISSKKYIKASGTKNKKEIKKRTIKKSKKPIVKKSKKNQKNVGKIKVSSSVKKSSPKIKRVPKAKAKDKINALIEDLVSRGKQRGFITEDEIIHAFPDMEKNIEELEDLYSKLETGGVKIVSSGEVIKEETDKIGRDFSPEKIDKKKEIEDVEPNYNDSVQMYLREIGKVSLLKADEEVR